MPTIEKQVPHKADKSVHPHKLEIVHAAVICFPERGYHQTCIRDIAKQADIDPGNLYNHFEGKEAVLAFIADIKGEELPEFPSDLVSMLKLETGSSATSNCPKCQRRSKSRPLSITNRLVRFRWAGRSGIRGFNEGVCDGRYLAAKGVSHEEVILCPSAIGRMDRSQMLLSSSN